MESEGEKREETKYRQTFCLGRKKKFDMSPLGLLCGAEERHFGESATETERDTHTVQRERGREGCECAKSNFCAQ